MDELARMAHLVRYLWWRGEFSDEECAHALFALTGRDDSGDLWTIGANTGHWYRRAGDSWHAGEPRGTLLTAVAADAYEQLLREWETPYRLEDRATPEAPLEVAEAVPAAGGPPPVAAEPPPAAAESEAHHPTALPTGPPATATRTCPACAAQMPPDARFCMYCGAPLGEARL